MRNLTELVAIASAGALLLSGCGGGDGEYPSEAVDLTIPFAAGGATDLAGRAMAEGLASELGQPFNPTNREGANQITAVTHVMQSRPDGYSLLVDGGGSSTLQSLSENLPYEWDDRDFIGRVAWGSHAYAVGKGAGISSMDELVDSLKSDPAQFSVAWLGGTSTSDFATLQLLEHAGVDPDAVKYVPFTGTGDAMQAAAAGDVDLAVGGSSAITSLYSSGDLVPLLLTAEDPNFPEIPLAADEGYEDLDVLYWVGLSGPSDLPDNVVDTLSGTLAGLESDQAMVDEFEKLGMTVEVVTGDEFETYIKEEAETFDDLSELVGE